MKTKGVIFELELRTHDIDGKKIDVEKDVQDINNAIAKFWNVVSIDIQNK